MQLHPCPGPCFLRTASHQTQSTATNFPLHTQPLSESHTDNIFPCLYLEALNLSAQRLCWMYHTDELAHINASGGRLLPGRIPPWQRWTKCKTLEANIEVPACLRRPSHGRCLCTDGQIDRHYITVNVCVCSIHCWYHRELSTSPLHMIPAIGVPNIYQEMGLWSQGEK